MKSFSRILFLFMLVGSFQELNAAQHGKIKSKGKAVVDHEEDFLHYYYQGDWTYYNVDGKPEQVITYERGKEVAYRKAAKARKQ